MTASISTSVADRLQATGTANALELRGVSRMFGALAALTDINLTVRPGERRAVLGRPPASDQTSSFQQREGALIGDKREDLGGDDGRWACCRHLHRRRNRRPPPDCGPQQQEQTYL